MGRADLAGGRDRGGVRPDPAVAVVPRRRIRTIIEEGEHETTQVTVRGTVLLLTLLLAVTEQFHLDAVLGAFLAGMVLRRWAGRGLPALEGKLDALGYGFFIPIFFVYSGMTMDLRRWPRPRCGCCCSPR